MLPRLISDNLHALHGIGHGFFTRNGGVSEGLFSSLNAGYGSGDDIGHVSINRQRVSEALCPGSAEISTVFQVHGTHAAVLNTPWAWGEAPQADAIVTATPGTAIGVLSADCVPVLFADAKNRVIAAAHAGWKGALSGIIESTVVQMQAAGADIQHIHAAIGPAIGAASYEVTGEFYARFIEVSQENSCFFVPQAQEKYLFDIKAYVEKRIAAAGIRHINMLANDTCIEEDNFFSYRRTTKRQQAQYGRQVSGIVLL